MGRTYSSKKMHRSFDIFSFFFRNYSLYLLKYAIENKSSNLCCMLSRFSHFFLLLRSLVNCYQQCFVAFQRLTCFCSFVTIIIGSFSYFVSICVHKNERSYVCCFFFFSLSFRNIFFGNAWVEMKYCIQQQIGQYNKSSLILSNVFI